jgi:hypothetical protein
MMYYDVEKEIFNMCCDVGSFQTTTDSGQKIGYCMNR